MEQKVKELYDCKQNVFSWLYEKYELLYQTVAVGKLVFQYNKNDNTRTIGERIDPFRQCPVAWHPVLDLDEHLGQLPANFSDMNNLLNQGIPVIMTGDLYDCDWNAAYRKYHFFHYWLVVEKRDDNYCICDPYFEQYDIVKSKEEVLELSKAFRAYTLKNTNSGNTLNNIRQKISEDVSFYLDNRMSEQMEDFLSDLLSVNLMDEKICEDIYAVPLLDNLKIIGKQRGAYALLIDVLQTDVCQNWNEIETDLWECMNLWDKVRVSLTKSILRRRTSCDTEFIETSINRIIQLEKEIIEKLSNV